MYSPRSPSTACTPAPAQVGDAGARLVGGSRDVDAASSRLERTPELVDVALEVVDGPHPNPVRSLAERLGVRKRAPPVEPALVHPQRRRVGGLLGMGVPERRTCRRAEARARLGEVRVHARTPRASAVARWTTGPASTRAARPRR